MARSTEEPVSVKASILRRRNIMRTIANARDPPPPWTPFLASTCRRTAQLGVSVCCGKNAQFWSVKVWSCAAKLHPASLSKLVRMQTHLK